MAGRRTRTTGAILASLGIIVAVIAAPAAAGRDRTAPTVPTDLRVTGTTAYGISLAWTASKDSSGINRYVICCNSSNSMTVSGSATSATFTAGVDPNRTYSLFVMAWDNAGNGSKNSLSVSARTAADVTVPSTPVVTVTDVGPTWVSLAWSSTDDDPTLWYHLSMNGSMIRTATRDTSTTVAGLSPSTTYSFTAQAGDSGGHRSAISPAVSVTTEAADGTDTTPPTPVTNVIPFLQEVDGETWLLWTESTDDVTPQFAIRYDIYLNGAFSHSIVGFNRMIEYGVPLSFNTWTIIAVDSAGNESAPVTVTTNNTGNWG